MAGPWGVPPAVARRRGHAGRGVRALRQLPRRPGPGRPRLSRVAEGLFLHEPEDQVGSPARGGYDAGGRLQPPPARGTPGADPGGHRAGDGLLWYPVPTGLSSTWTRNARPSVRWPRAARLFISRSSGAGPLVYMARKWLADPTVAAGRASSSGSVRTPSAGITFLSVETSTLELRSHRYKGDFIPVSRPFQGPLPKLKLATRLGLLLNGEESASWST